MLALLARIEEHARKVAGLQCEEIAAGPFRALIHPTSDVSWFSYAVPYGPLDDAVGVGEHLRDLRRLFHARERTFRFEFTESLWPTLPGEGAQAVYRRIGFRNVGARLNYTEPTG